MNTRIQVEHAVTEAITGRDLVRDQVRVAAGEPLGFVQDEVRWNGHAIECRINAEDVARGFLPSPGTITEYEEPDLEHVRVDSGVRAGATVSPHYDSLLAKVVVWGPTREAATERMRDALDRFRIGGVPTLIPFHRALLSTPQWAAAETCTDLTTDADWLGSTVSQPV